MICVKSTPKLAEHGGCCYTAYVEARYALGCARNFFTAVTWDRQTQKEQDSQLSESQVYIQFSSGSKVMFLSTPLLIASCGCLLWGHQWESAFHYGNWIWTSCSVVWCVNLIVWMCQVYLMVLYTSTEEGNLRKTLSLICSLDHNQGWEEW